MNLPLLSENVLAIRRLPHGYVQTLKYCLIIFQFVDGRDVRCVNLAFLRSKIGLVFQEPILFEGTIYDNIVYGSDTGLITTGDVERAAKTANIHDFISNLEKVQYKNLSDSLV